jgi:adenylosuccinate synthase
MTVTCLDVLSGQSELKICTGYDINGEITEHFPINCTLNDAKPVYVSVPGWSEDITECRTFDSLPVNARNYILKLQDMCGVKVSYVSVGPKREALIVMD